MTDVRLGPTAVVVDGDLRVEEGGTLAVAAIDGQRARFIHEVSSTEVAAQVIYVHGALRATADLTARGTASVPVEAASIALDHPTAPRFKKRVQAVSSRAHVDAAEAQRNPVEPSPGPRPEPMDPVPRRLALMHEFGNGSDRLVLNHQRRYTQGVRVDGDLVVSGALSQASSSLLKHDVEALAVNEAARAIEALRPVTFRYRADQAGRRHAGFIAEEVAAIVPDAPHLEVRPVDLIAMLTVVVQDQQRAIAVLQEQVTVLASEDRV